MTSGIKRASYGGGNGFGRAVGGLRVHSGSVCRTSDNEEIAMSWKIWVIGGTAALVLVAAGAVSADDVKPSDEGRAAEFKGKTFDLKAKGEAAILLSCPAGKEVTATTKGEKETDVHLFVYGADKKEVGKDTSPGPKCEVKFTPQSDGKFKLLVRNL